VAALQVGACCLTLTGRSFSAMKLDMVQLELCSNFEIVRMQFGESAAKFGRRKTRRQKMRRHPRLYILPAVVQMLTSASALLGEDPHTESELKREEVLRHSIR